ncbi:MAG: ATP-binding protein [Victivallaceae bacterium]|nr:ATP-binding protein [Victivallaceae bacterium]
MNLQLGINWSDLIYRGIESEELDYKAAQNWKSLPRSGKAKFVRHCLALANTKGGYVVVGVGEDNAGKPSLYTGLTEEQSKSFDPTAVGNFINKYADPQINFTVERPVIDDKQYVVFAIQRFDDIPHVCSQGCEHELQQGIFYIRTADASSRPAYRASEIHNIVRRSLRNQRETLGRMIRGILYEDRQIMGDDNINRFNEHINHSRALFQRKKHPATNAVIIEIAVTPATYVENRFSLSELKKACHNSLYIASENSFISKQELDEAYSSNVSLRCLPQAQVKLWQMFQTGFFYYRIQPATETATVNYPELVRLISEAVFFFGQFYEELGFDEEMLDIAFRLEHVEDVLLAQAPAGRCNELTGYRCRIPEIKYSIRRTAVDLASGDVDHAVKIIRELGERFNMPESRHLRLPQTIRDYLDKR